MAKKRCWFGWVRRLFVSEQKPKAEKKSKKWRWVLGRLKVKQCLALPAPHRTIDEATETQKKYALTVALATAAAAEAAVAAAHAAAEVVRLTGASQSPNQLTKAVENLAAIKIQSAFRAYLARKALRALKGLVRLQAIVRGRAVRRQAVIKLKHLPSKAKKRSEIQAKGISAMDGICKDGENKQLLKSKMEEGEKENKVGEMISKFLKPKKEVGEKENKGKNHKKVSQPVHMLECNIQRNWDYSRLSREDIEALWFRKHEANIKRERMMKYSFSHRERGNTQMLDESLSNKVNGRQSHRMEQWPNLEGYNRDRMENLKSRAISDLFAADIFSPAQVKTRSSQRQDFIEGLNTPVSLPRRSFGRTRSSLGGDGNSLPNSPVFPTYMAATQSAMAKARSMSTPKQRVGFQDAYFDHSLPSKNGLSFWSTYNGESLGIRGKGNASQHLSISVNGRY